MNVYSQVLESCKPFFHRYPEKYSDDDQGAGSAAEAEAEGCKEAKGGESKRNDTITMKKDRKLNPSPFQSISIDVDVAGGDGDDANVGTNVDNISKSFPTIGGPSNLPDSKSKTFEIEKSHSYLDIDMDKHRKSKNDYDNDDASSMVVLARVKRKYQQHNLTQPQKEGTCSMSMDNNEADAIDAAVAGGGIRKIKRPVSDGPGKSPLSSEDQSKQKKSYSGQGLDKHLSAHCDDSTHAARSNLIVHTKKETTSNEPQSQRGVPQFSSYSSHTTSSSTSTNSQQNDELYRLIQKGMKALKRPLPMDPESLRIRQGMRRGGNDSRSTQGLRIVSENMTSTGTSGTGSGTASGNGSGSSGNGSG